MSMYNVDVQCQCTMLMYNVNVQSQCIISVYSVNVHVFLTCKSCFSELSLFMNMCTISSFLQTIYMYIHVILLHVYNTCNKDNLDKKVINVLKFFHWTVTGTVH